jgi:hypothetical protein
MYLEIRDGIKQDSELMVGNPKVSDDRLMLFD